MVLLCLLCFTCNAAYDYISKVKNFALSIRAVDNSSNTMSGKCVSKEHFYHSRLIRSIKLYHCCHFKWRTMGLMQEPLVASDLREFVAFTYFLVFRIYLRYKYFISNAIVRTKLYSFDLRIIIYKSE